MFKSELDLLEKEIANAGNLENQALMQELQQLQYEEQELDDKLD